MTVDKNHGEKGLKDLFLNAASKNSFKILSKSKVL